MTAMDKVGVWGIGFDPMTRSEALAHLDALAERRESGYVISANVNFAMLAARHPDVAEISRAATLVLVDGMPLVWASRGRLPERVAGSDLFPDLLALAARRGYGVYFMGATEESLSRAVAIARECFPRLSIVGTQTSDDPAPIRRARPHFLFVALGQPKGERWIARHPLSGTLVMQVGASIDFFSGEQRRAPRWMQRAGLEWAFRCVREPRRLGPRYVANIVFAIASVRHMMTRSSLVDRFRT